MRFSFPAKSAAAAVPSGCAVAMGLLFVVAAGTFFSVMGWKLLREVWEVRGWPEVGCVVEQADVNVTVAGEPQAELALRYRYRPAGEWLNGYRLRLGAAASQGSVNELEEIGAGLRAVPERLCRYRPGESVESVLEKPGYGLGLVVVAAGTIFSVMGLLAVASGLGLVRAWRGFPAKLGPLLIGLVFALGGLAVWRFGLQPGRALQSRADAMVTVPCEVVASRVKVGSGSGRSSGPTYRPDIWYRYEVGGRTWHSAWADFSRGKVSTGNAGASQTMVARFAVGSKTVCHVDPERPWVAVLEKKGGAPWWLWLMSLLFGGIGLAVAGGALWPLLRAEGLRLRGRRRGV